MKQTTVTQVAALFDGDAFLAVSVNGDIKYSGRADTLATNKVFSDVLVSSISTPVTADSATILRVGDQNETHKKIIECRISKLATPIDDGWGSYCYYEADIYESTDGGKHFWFSRFGSYFHTIEEAEEYKDVIEQAEN